ncbi:unnamed protein product [Prorocentrum cordatum]|uniref:Cytochrome c-550 domain-containing protein n=1 Tax=Prorocentrum cordatum TaxID=2364126 RepID=A0ABN9SP78_9DINO|nr:unnamed protein product [Polarella glacialis]
MPVLGRLQRRSSSALDRSPAPAWPLVVPPRVVRGPSWLEALAPEAPEKPPHQAPPRGPGHHGRPEGRELRAAWHLRAGPARPAAGLRRPSGQQRPRRGRRRGARGGGAPWRRHGAGARHARQLRPSPRQRRRGRRAAGADRGARARGNRGRGHPRRRQGQDQEPEQGGADPREAPVQRRVRDVPRRRRHPHQPERGPGHRGPELSGAFPPRNTIDSLVDYINAPTTYDGLKDISEVHPSIIAADLWPKMRSMKQQDLYDISAYILYQNYVIPEKWGGGKQYY